MVFNSCQISADLVDKSQDLWTFEPHSSKNKIILRNAAEIERVKENMTIIIELVIYVTEDDSIRNTVEISCGYAELELRKFLLPSTTLAPNKQVLDLHGGSVINKVKIEDVQNLRTDWKSKAAKAF
jgi:hypothetical protein